MIAASEPLEFVPHGRTVLAKHPGQIYGKAHNVSPSENSLLYKLTNFAIKDESFLEGREEEQEWWCIREVYHRSDEVQDTTNEQQRETKFEYDSFRPPSRLKNDFNISIKSEILRSMPKEESVPSGPSRGGSANSSSMSKKFNLNCSQMKRPKKKPLNPKIDSYYEEELYVKGCTVVWSKGLVSSPGTKLSEAEQRETIACYTIDNPIKHAAFANFHVDIKNTMLIDALNSQIGDVKKNIKIEDNTEHIESTIMPSILLMDNKCMRVFATDGREYMTSIPFQVKKVWPMKYGVLLEKEAIPSFNKSLFPTSFSRFNESHNNSSFSKSRTNLFNMSAKLRAESISGFDQDFPLPTCFSLSHPLDDVTPVLMKSPSQGLQYYNEGDLQIMFVSSEPSIILVYDWKVQIHSLWKIRKATRDECLSMCPNTNTTTFSQTCDFVGSPMHSMKNTSWTVGSPMQSRKSLATPTRSRQNSPMANIFQQQGLSPHTSIGQASSMSMMAGPMTQAPPSLPLYPDICLDHIWTDNQVIKRDPIESPSDMQAFLHTDIVGLDYLCFMVKVCGLTKLQIVRLQKSHSHGNSKPNIIVGTVSSVLAKDAVVLNHLKMIALIDETGNIILQSGNNFVGKVHVGGILARLLDSPYTKRPLQSPFPRRSSLLPSRSDATLDDPALHLLSPVPHSAATRRHHTQGVRRLCDAAGSRVSVRSEAGQLYRIALPPPTAAPLVARLAAALAAAAPRDVTAQVLIKWYGVRNAPGTQDLTPEQEWTMFSNLLYSLIGYDVEKLSQRKQNDEEVEVVTKKQRTSSDGSQDDWEYLLTSKLHKEIGNPLASMLNLKPLQTDKYTRTGKSKLDVDMEKAPQFNTNAMLFPYTVQLFYAFHLAYEDLKLNTLLSSDLKPLSSFLYQLSKDLRLEKYSNYYWLDFPTEYSFENDDESQMSEPVLKKLSQPNYFTTDPPNIFSYIDAMLKDVDVGYYTYMTDVNNTTKDIIEILCLAGYGAGAGVRGAGAREAPPASSTPRVPAPCAMPAARAARAAADRGMTPRDIDNLPPSVSLLLLTVLARCKSDPPADWDAAAYTLVGREDLALQADISDTLTSALEYCESLALEVLEKETAYTQTRNPIDEPRAEDSDLATGMEHLSTKLLALQYPKDRRMTEVFNLLQSSIPVSINLTQRPEVSDHDFIEEQEKYLYAISTRTMALPIARGMLTLRSLPCSPTEPLTLPRLNVSGRGPPPRCSAVTLGGGDTPPHCLLWPTFHNGVAAGLALVPVTGTNIHSSWIMYNKPRGTAEMSTEHAGFLLGLGLNGHLRDMPFMNMYDYLVRCNEMTSIGLLLGLAATYRGTMDVQATKMMSIHLEALLPPTSVELDIQQGVLTAALLGVGLLYQGTAHDHLARVLLAEIGKPAGAEAESCVEREGAALAAGLALGLICAGVGPRLGLAPRLRSLMLGGAGSNLDVTAPGATLALGLLYMKSNSAPVAAWLAPPATAYLLDTVRPDLLMLRIIARGLVLWDEMEPSEEWVENQVPATIKPYCFVKPTEDNIDYEAMNQAYCNIVAGACFALGLRFAGSGCEDARDTALAYAALLARAGGPAGAATLDACACACLLAAAMVCAGRGDLNVLRLARRLRARKPLAHSTQMAVHAAIGLLFVGGGRGTLCTTPSAVASLLVAFFPKFPTHSEDNRYHLQAFRHLYVLAVEPRLLLPRDLHTGKLCYAHVQVIDLSGAVREMKAPCIIPELDTLREVRVNDPRYWPISFHRDHNWDQLRTFLEYTWCIDIKQRAGCLSYSDDPDGFLTILARTLTLEPARVWSASENIELFTNDEKIRNFVKHYLGESAVGMCGDCLATAKKKKGIKSDMISRQCLCRKPSKAEQEYIQALSMLTYECVVKDILCALPVWTTFLKIIKTMKTEPTSYHMWQIKLLLSQIDAHHKRSNTDMTVDGTETNEPLVSTQFVVAIKQKVANIFDKWEGKITPYLRKYLGLPSSRNINSCEEDIKRMLSTYVVYHDLPRSVLRNVDDELSLVLCSELNLSAEAVSKIEALVR
ncbi:anaphase-promoting complex subunit 1 [Aricia agestis]|uniref:anaphase-promoting complex subunit 1 n=1 Tax=Aricia agestis TaxID=91739 RepID=UPI001C208688|nr:anaphase-promoting complex subunit 1 [Aricia agestis]